MKKVVSVFAFLVIGISVFAQTKWSVDPVHSLVGFSVKHLSISDVAGSFKKFDGSYTVSRADLSDLKANFSIDVASVNTSSDQRDGHLKSDDFFNAEKFPNLKFESTSFKKVKGNNYLLAGKLTIRDVTKDVTFNVVYGGSAKDPWGNTKSGFSATTVINRFDYNVKYDATGLAVGKEVTLNLNLEFIQGK